MDCTEARRWISDRLDGALDAAREKALKEHLAGCASCRAEEQAVGRLDAAMRASPASAVPAGLGPRISLAARPPHSRLGRFVLLPLAAVAAAAIVVAVVLSHRGGGPGPEMKQPGPAGPGPEVAREPSEETEEPGLPVPSTGETADRGRPERTQEATAEPGAAAAVDSVAFEAVETLRDRFTAAGTRDDVLDALDRAELFLELAASELDEAEPDLSDIKEQIGEAGLTALFQGLTADPAVAGDPRAEDAATELAATFKSLAEGG